MIDNKYFLEYCLTFDSVNEFVEYWEKRYDYSNESKYDNNIRKPLNEKSLNELFEWKNGSNISVLKKKSIENNYPFFYDGNKEERYLNHKKSGGAIWNIFYLHCLDPDTYPIFDQHTYRSMIYLKTGKIVEIPNRNKEKYQIYVEEYMPFVNSFEHINQRTLDKALFAFGRFLKVVEKFTTIPKTSPSKQ